MPDKMLLWEKEKQLDSLRLNKSEKMKTSYEVGRRFINLY